LPSPVKEKKSINKEEVKYKEQSALINNPENKDKIKDKVYKSKQTSYSYPEEKTNQQKSSSNQSAEPFLSNLISEDISKVQVNNSERNLPSSISQKMPKKKKKIPLKRKVPNVFKK